jgi:hypothetical protein
MAGEKVAAKHLGGDLAQRHRIPFIYVRDSTKIEDHFDYRWEAPWGRYRDKH